MSVVIIGGNDCMVRKYKELCKVHNCKAKVFTQPRGNLKKQIGSPDLLVLFTGTVSHKMVSAAVREGERSMSKIVRSHSSSTAALSKILSEFAV